MTRDQSSPTSTYCRKCGYQLVGLSENRCPECGRVFDLADRRTFFQHAGSYRRRWWIWRIAWSLVTVALVGTLFVAACFGWMYWKYHADWRTEQQAIAALQADTGNRVAVYNLVWGFDWGPLYHLSRPLYYPRTRVGVVKVEGPLRSQVDLTRLAVFKQCYEIRLTNLGLADEDLRHLEGLTQLTQLGLASNPGITDGGLVRLKTLTSLTVLDLSGTGVTVAGLKHLQSLPRLRELSLAGTQVRGKDLDALKAFPSLQRLVLGGPSITDADLAHVKALPLTFLTASGTGITDAGLKEVGQMARLELLNVSSTAITDAALVGQLARLELLDLSSTAITDTGLQHLSGLSSLRLLDLRNTAVTDAALAHLKVLPKLRFLYVQGTKVTSEGVRQLQKALPSLGVEGP